jgi:hypothetical protein
VRKGCTCRVLDRDEAGLPELRVPDREDPALQIHVPQVQSQRFARPKTGSGKKTDERHMGQRAQSFWRGEPSGLGHETFDFLVGKDVGLVAPVTSIEEPLWWDFRSWVEYAQPGSEPSHHGKASCPCCSLRTLRFLRPTDSEVGGDELRSLAFEELHEMTKRHGRLSKPGA